MRIQKKAGIKEIDVFEVTKEGIQYISFSADPIGTANNFLFDTVKQASPNFTLNPGTGDITCNKDGKYRIEYVVSVGATSNPSQAFFGFEFIKNGLPETFYYDSFEVVNQNLNQQKSYIHTLDLLATQVINIRLVKLSIGNVSPNIVTGIGLNRLNIIKL